MKSAHKPHLAIRKRPVSLPAYADRRIETSGDALRNYTSPQHPTSTKAVP